MLVNPIDAIGLNLCTNIMRLTPGGHRTGQGLMESVFSLFCQSNAIFLSINLFLVILQHSILLFILLNKICILDSLEIIR